MKPHLITLFSIAFTISSFADEIKLHGANWNDLSNALDITPLYLEVSSSTSARRVNLILEVFQNGKLTKSYPCGGISGKDSKPIDFQSALFFCPKDGSSEYTATWTLTWNNTSGTTRFTVPKSIIDFHGTAFSAASPTISSSSKSLLATIVCNSKEGFSIGDTIESTISANKTATVIALYLERE